MTLVTSIEPSVLAGLAILGASKNATQELSISNKVELHLPTGLRTKKGLPVSLMTSDD